MAINFKEGWIFKQIDEDEIAIPLHDEVTLQSEDDKVTLVDRFVRETMQNVIDARSGEEPAKLIITLPKKDKEEEMIFESEAWLENLYKHLKASKEKIEDPAFINFLDDGGLEKKSLKYMLVEDENTKGLAGEWDRSDGENKDNHFLAYFYGDGVSNKGGEEGGSFGFGRTVHQAGSQIHSTFTISHPAVPNKDLRNEDFLMGQSRLALHSLGKVSYTPRGLYGSQEGKGKIIEPFGKNSEQLKKAEETFKVSRVKRKCPGVSIIIVEPKEALLEKDAIVFAVIAYYFTAIAYKEIEVTVHQEGEDSTTLKDMDDCENALKEMSFEHPNAENNLELSKNNLIKMIWLESDAQTAPNNARKFILDEFKGAFPRTPRSVIPDMAGKHLDKIRMFLKNREIEHVVGAGETYEAISEELGIPVGVIHQSSPQLKNKPMSLKEGDTLNIPNSRQMVFLDIPVPVTKKRKKGAKGDKERRVVSNIEVAIKYDEEEKKNKVPGMDYYVRGSLQIPDINVIDRRQGYMVFVRVTGALAELLRLTEGPGHGNWIDKERAQKKYENVNPTIKFVTNCVDVLIGEVERVKPDQIDRDTLSNLLRVDVNTTEEKTKTKTKTETKTDQDSQTEEVDVDEIDTSEIWYTTAYSRGTFTIKSEDLKADGNTAVIEGELGYARFDQTNAFKKHNILDFDLTRQKDFRVRTENCTYSILGPNRFQLVADVSGDENKPELVFRISGFDRNRDVTLKTISEVPNDE